MEPGETVTVVGAGLAGSEAALQLAARDVPVRLVEMRPATLTPAHRTGLAAELVCSNSLKSDDPSSAAGSLKVELEAMGSRLLAIARSCRVPAGGALAVDRNRFSNAVDSALDAEPLVTRCTALATEIPDPPAIIATGPLTADSLAEDLRRACGRGTLAFYDAAAPIVTADSIDTEIVFAQSRYGKGGGADYLNAPLERGEYDAFVSALVSAERVISRDFERRELFSACQPVEEVARTGPDALSHGAMKPVGLTDPRTSRRPWAAVQLRAENAERTAYNLVGFQTNLRFGEQERVFRMIPGLERAEFARYGVMHRNTFLDAPRVLSPTLELRCRPGVRVAGQLSGTEGYVEAIASGLFAALATYAELRSLEPPRLPRETLFGCLLAHATDPLTSPYQPMHVNYGIIAPLEVPVRGKRERRSAYAERAHTAIHAWVAERTDLFD